MPIDVAQFQDRRTRHIEVMEFRQRSISRFNHLGRGVAVDVKHRIRIIGVSAPVRWAQPLECETLQLGAQRLILPG
jgi:hypothetical protein